MIAHIGYCAPAPLTISGLQLRFVPARDVVLRLRPWSRYRLSVLKEVSLEYVTSTCQNSSMPITRAPDDRAVTTSPVCRLVLMTCLSLMGPSAIGQGLLGEVVSVSPLGAPLRVEIRSPGSTPTSVADCVRVMAGDGAVSGIERIREARVSLIGSGSEARLLVQRAEPVHEPVVQLMLRNNCGARLHRDYTLLLDPPAARPAVAAPARTAAPREPERARSTTPSTATTWTSAPGESLASIAQAMHPRDAAARRAFVDGVRRANPGLFGDAASTEAPLPAGTAFAVPSPRAVAAAASAAPTRPASPAAPAATSSGATPPPAAAPASVARPPGPATSASSPDATTPVSHPARLIVEGEQGPAALANAGDDALAREERLIEAVDRTIKLQLELMERLRRLEDIQAGLQARLEALDALPAPATAAPPALTTPAPPAIAPAVAANDIPERTPPQSDAPTGQQTTWAERLDALLPGAESRLWLLLAAMLVAVVAIIAWIRRRDARRTMGEALDAASGEAAWPDEARVDVGERAARPTDHEPPPAATPESPPRTPRAPIPALDWHTGEEVARPVTGRSVANSLSNAPAAPAPFDAEAETLPPLQPGDSEIAEEHDSAVELADIMISFGRVHGAAETLADFIRSNPKQAITPWLKLMDVYRMAGMRMEFDALARQLNKTFNVKTVTWDNFDEARKPAKGLEDLPHIVSALTESWGTRECQAYLEKLLRDNRDGAREGFPIAIIDDILALAGILEEHLGRFRPESDAEPREAA